MTQRILVVDDDPLAVELLQEFLPAKGYDVIVARDGEEALRKAREESPHAILLDVRMPKMEGIEVLRRVREINQEVTVIMTTAVDEEEIGRQAVALGAFDYVTKPLNLRYLEHCLWYKLTMRTL